MWMRSVDSSFQNSALVFTLSYLWRPGHNPMYKCLTAFDRFPTHSSRANTLHLALSHGALLVSLEADALQDGLYNSANRLFRTPLLVLNIRAWISVFLLTTCVTLGEIFNLPTPQFPQQLNGGNNSTHLTELLD